MFCAKSGKLLNAAAIEAAYLAGLFPFFILFLTMFCMLDKSLFFHGAIYSLADVLFSGKRYDISFRKISNPKK